MENEARFTCCAHYATARAGQIRSWAGNIRRKSNAELILREGSPENTKKATDLAGNIGIFRLTNF
jgi:hypothetical protein